MVNKIRKREPRRSGPKPVRNSGLDVKEIEADDSLVSQDRLQEMFDSSMEDEERIRLLESGTAL